METIYTPVNIRETLTARAFPSIVMWNRLEGRPRTINFDRALKAEVRDALWMLSKQWQMGEFKADDAGSPVVARIHLSTATLDHFKAAENPVQPYEPNVPMEVKAECKKIPFTLEGKDISIDIRLQMGRYWLKLLKKENLVFESQYIAQYPFSLPEKNRDTEHIYAHQDYWQHLSAISGRCLDGYKLCQYLLTGGNQAADNITNTDPDKTALNSLGDLFKTWCRAVYYQPGEATNDAWLPDRLEYQFECSAVTGNTVKTLSAEQYHQGNLDWYAFNIQEQHSNGPGAGATITDTFMPTHVKFDGMPETRWWKFEDSKTSFGNITPATTDLSKLLLMEFALLFANDWFLVPVTLPIGSLTKVEGFTIKNNFGETTWVNSAEVEHGPSSSWSMFKMSSESQNNTLFLAPAAAKIHESDPLEEIVLIRDEMSNMVWGIESVVPMPPGKGQKGNEVALRTRQYHEKIVTLVGDLLAEAGFYRDYAAPLPSTPDLMAIRTEIDRIIADLQVGSPGVYQLVIDLDQVKTDLNTAGYSPVYTPVKKENDYKAPISYQAMTSVPENWIPFIPVHTKENTPYDTREIQLQRASMLRLIDGDPLMPVKIKPRTSILREGLDPATGPQRTYYIHEEEVPRSGAIVSQSFQRTRWVNGEVFVWLGMRKDTGKGEGSGGLAFDQIINSPQS